MSHYPEEEQFAYHPILRTEEVLPKDPNAYMHTQSYQNVRDAVEQAFIGQDPLTIEELATAITSGLYQSADQVATMIELMKEIGECTGRPIDIYDRTDEHR